MRSYYVLWIICVPDKCSRYCDLFHCSSKLGYHRVAIVEISILEPCVNRCPLVVTGYSSLWFFCLPSSAPQNTHMPLLQETQVRIIAIVKKIFTILNIAWCTFIIRHPLLIPIVSGGTFRRVTCMFTLVAVHVAGFGWSYELETCNKK